MKRIFYNTPLTRKRNYIYTKAYSQFEFIDINQRNSKIRARGHAFFEGRVGVGWDELGTRTHDEDYVSLLASMKKRPLGDDRWQHMIEDI